MATGVPQAQLTSTVASQVLEVKKTAGAGELVIEPHCTVTVTELLVQPETVPAKETAVVPGLIDTTEMEPALIEIVHMSPPQYACYYPLMVRLRRVKAIMSGFLARF